MTRCVAGTITKTVRGNKYTYYEYFEDGKTVQKYCGPEGSRRAKVRSLEIEYRLLEKKRMIVTGRMSAIKKEMEMLQAGPDGDIPDDDQSRKDRFCKLRDEQ